MNKENRKLSLAVGLVVSSMAVVAPAFEYYRNETTFCSVKRFMKKIGSNN